MVCVAPSHANDVSAGLHFADHVGLPDRLGPFSRQIFLLNSSCASFHPSASTCGPSVYLAHVNLIRQHV